MSARRATAVQSSAMRVWLCLACGVALGCSVGSSPPAQPDRPVPGITVDAPCVDRVCGEGLMCRVLEPGAPRVQAANDRCVLEPGRCRDDWDCARSIQRCRRFGTRLGVCQDRGI